MTVAELIDKLKACPQDLPVVYIDYEQGDMDIERVETDFDHYAGSPTLQPEKATKVILSWC